MVELFNIKIEGNFLYTDVVLDGTTAPVYNLVYDISKKGCPLVKTPFKEKSYMQGLIEGRARDAFLKYPFDKMPEHIHYIMY